MSSPPVEQRLISGLRWIRPLLFVVPIVLVLIASRQGIGLDWDAVVYLSAAESFAETGRLLSYSGLELTTFAPGLPTLVGVLLKTGASFNAIGIVLNVVAVVVTVVCSYAIAREILESILLSWIVVALVCLSVSTVRVFSMLKTEAPFTALLLITMVLCLWAMRTQRTPWWWFVSVAAAVSTATTFRYIGLTLIPLVALAALVASRGHGKWRSLGSAVVLAVASSAGLVGVALRNTQLGAPPLGPRSPSGLTAARVTTDLLSTLGSFLYPSTEVGPLQITCGVLVGALIVLGAVAAVQRRSVPSAFLVLFVGGYLASLVYSEFSTVIEPINLRLLGPIFPLLAVLAVSGVAWLVRLTRTSDEAPSRASRLVLAVALVLLAITLIVSTIAAVAFARESSREGIGYNSVASRESPTANAVRELPCHAGIAALNGPRLYMATRCRSFFLLPASNLFNRPEVREPRIRQLKGQVRAGRISYFVYFKSDSRDAVVTPKEFAASGLKLRRVARYEDGTIWEPSG